MKILCNKRIDKYSLNYYLGRDVWVKCRWKDAYPKDWWVRIISEVTPGVFHANLVNDILVSKRMLSDDFVIEAKNFTILRPLEVINSDELLGE